MGTDSVLITVDDQNRAAHPCTQIVDGVLVQPATRREGDKRFRVRLEAPADAIFDLLRRVRLGEALREEELEKPFVVASPVVLVELRPTLVGLERLVERMESSFGMPRCDRKRRGDEESSLDSLRVLGGEDERPLRAERQRHDDGAFDLHCVQYGQRVAGELVLGVRI